MGRYTFLLICCLGWTAFSSQNRVRPMDKKSTEIKTEKKQEKELDKKIEPTQKKIYGSSTSHWSTVLEAGIQPVKSANYDTKTCYQGQLQVDYNLLGSFYTGLFGKTLFYYQNIDVVSIDNKIIDMGSIDYHSVGISLSYGIPLSRIAIVPKLDLSYDFFTAKAIDYTLDKTSFLDYRYLSLAPKLNIRYKISDGFSIGLYGGYQMQLTALKGAKIGAFDPSGYTLGLSSRIVIMK